LIHTYEKEIGVHSKRKVLTARARFPLGSHNKDNNFLWANKQTTQTSFGGAIVRLVSNTNNFFAVAMQANRRWAGQNGYGGHRQTESLVRNVFLTTTIKQFATPTLRPVAVRVQTG